MLINILRREGDEEKISLHVCAAEGMWARVMCKLFNWLLSNKKKRLAPVHLAVFMKQATSSADTEADEQNKTKKQ